ncbi:LamG domain-containing protein [Candidatus Pacearchaeota archaeon]|nr:LamG domain-containing protein [Candidatus Pacearchaeota archaeon]
MIYPPNQKPPIWAIDPGIIAHNCQIHGFPRPVIAMPMWEGAGARVMDYSGRGNNGLLVGPPVWVGDGLNFSGDSVDLGDHDITGDFTIISEVYKESSGLQTIFGKANSAGDSFSYYFRIDGGAGFYNGSTYEQITTPDLTLNSWQHIALAYDGSDLTYYLNGDSSVTGGATGIPANISDDARIGQLGEYTTGQQFDGIIRYLLFFDVALTPAQIKFLHDNPYFMYQVPEELYGFVAVSTSTGLLDCKLRIKDSSTVQVDGLLRLKDTKIDLLDGNLSILDVATNDVDGKVQIKDVDTNVLDGKAVVKDTDTNLSDGKVQVQDTATNLADGKVIFKDSTTGITDGKIRVKDVATGIADSLIRIKDSVANLVDGTVRIKDTVSSLADGKVVVALTGQDTGHADGKIRIKDVVTAFVDGKISVNIPGTDTGYVDGKIQIKDVTTGIVDGLIRIKDRITGQADGKVKITNSGTNLVDGAIKIKDSIVSLIDGRVRISTTFDRATNLFNALLQIPARYTITTSSEQQHTITYSSEQQHEITTSSEPQHSIVMIRDEE